MEFDSQSGPTYNLVIGLAGQSLALQTAERIGVDPEILKEAITFTSPEYQKYQNAMLDIDQTRAELSRAQKLLNQQLSEIEKERSHYKNLVEKFNLERDGLLEKEVTKARQKVDELIQVTQVKDVFKKYENLEKIKTELPTIIKHPDSQKERHSSQPSSAQEFSVAFPPGSHVHITSLGRDGIVQGQPNNRGEIPVLSQSMRLYANWQDLKPALKSQNPTHALIRKSGHFSYSSADTDRVVDLRGLNSDDAISQLEIQLDTASLGDEDRVKIVHGHGTETLKKTIRSYLSRSVYVKKWMAGTKENGGDGITWVELK